MIFYGVNKEFFSLKGEAETRRKQLGLGPSATDKISLSNREEAVEFLNDLVGSIQTEPVNEWDKPGDEEPVTHDHDAEHEADDLIGGDDDLIGGDDEGIPSEVPEFLLSDEQKKEREAQTDTRSAADDAVDDLI